MNLLFFRRRVPELTFQRRMESRLVDVEKKKEQRAKERAKKPDVSAVLLEMENFCKERQIDEFSVLIEQARIAGNADWLKYLLNVSMAYYMRLWLESRRRVLREARLDYKERLERINATPLEGEGSEMVIRVVPGFGGQDAQGLQKSESATL